jgi:predicted dehydrogenase
MMVRFGIVGLGGIARRFAGVIGMVEGVELVAVASSSGRRAEDFAREFGAKRFYEGYERLLEDKGVDVVYVAQTHEQHFDLIRSCLEAGKGVLCEKPMVLTEGEAVQVVELARKKGLLLMEGMWARFLPTYVKAKEWIAQGKIGVLKMIRASFCVRVPYDPKSRLFNVDTAGGSLYDLGVYPIEFATGFLGEEPKEIRAVGTFCENGVDGAIVMALKFEGEVLASLSCSFHGGDDREGFLYGENGFILFRDFLGGKKVELYDHKKQLLEVYEVDYEDGFSFEIEHFASLYREGKTESDIMPHRDNIATTKIFEEVLRQIKIN